MVNYESGDSLNDCAIGTLVQAEGDLWQPDYDCDGLGDACDDDDDNDGLTDEWELQYGGGGVWLNPLDPDTDDNGTPDGDEDFDAGGLLNIDEQENGSNPHLKDSDGDIWSDLMEVQAGTSPIDGEDSPDPSIFNNGIFVNKDTGSDYNLGIAAWPVRSIHAAFDRLNLLPKGIYTIRISAGIYSLVDVDLDPTKPLEPDTPIITSQNVIVEAPNVIMDGTGAVNWNRGFIFSPLSSNVTINGLHIVNFNEALVFNTDGGCAFLNGVNISDSQIGLRLVEAYQLKVDLTDSQISGCQTGVEFAGEGSDNTVRNVSNGIIQGNALEAVKVSGGSGNQITNLSIIGPGANGLKIEMGATDFTVSGGSIQGTDVGMGFATDGASISVSGATIQDCGAGIEFLENYMINVDLGTATLITNCETGILFTAGSANNTVLNGIIQGNDDGIRFERCADDPDGEAPADNRITGTEIKDNTANGIAILAGAANELIDVEVSGSATGVYMGSASSYNVLRGGTVSGTKENFNLDGSNNTIKGPMTLQSFGQVAGNGNELVDITLDGTLSTEPYGLLLDQGSEKIILKNVTIQNYDVGIGFVTNAACLNLTGVLIQDCRIGVDIRENYMLDIELGNAEIRNCDIGIEIAAGSSNNTIRNGSILGSREDGILIDGCNETPDENKIIGTTVQNSTRNGIALFAGFGNEVIGATVTGNNTDQIAGGYGGIALLNGSGAVNTSRIYDNGCTGVYLDDSAVANISGNLIYGQPEGIHVALVSDVTIASNTITDNGDSGIVIEDGALPMVKYNIIYGNGTSGLCPFDICLKGDFEPANLVENDIGTVNQIDLPPTNISVDPLFCKNDETKCDEPIEDYSLQRASFLIDGTTATEPGIDVRGSSRPKGDSWDMGAIETSSFRDADSDGLPDPWEEAYFGGLTDCLLCGADDDYDGDGVSNLQEYLEGSEPDNPVYVVITSPAKNPFFTDQGPLEIKGKTSVVINKITVTGTAIQIDGTLSQTPVLDDWSTKDYDVDVGLQPGGNLITVKASVDGYKDAKDTITVIDDDASPTVAITSPSTEGVYTTTLDSITLSGLANDDTEVASVSWFIVEDPSQNGPASGTSDWSNWTTSSIQLPTVTTEPVSITVRVTATDNFNSIPGSEDIVITRVPGATNVNEDLSDLGQEPSAPDPLDVDGDGYLNDDEIACGSDPLIHPDNYPGTGVPPVPSNYGTDGEPTSYPVGHDKEGYYWPDCLNPDIDGDGLPNWWEEEYFAGSPTDGDPEANDDGDIYDNQTEYGNGTDPTTPQNIAFVVTATDLGTGNGLPEFGKTFMVQATWDGSGPPPAQAIFSLSMTSNYPGRAENDPDPADMIGGGNYPSWYDYHGPDFGLTTMSSPDCSTDDCFSQGSVGVPDTGDGTYVVYLHSWDFGGRTKVVVTDPDAGNYIGQLWVPIDSDKNGISSAWDDYGDLSAVDPNADTDAIIFDGPGYTAPLGDDFTHFEEYRGIIYTETLGGPPKHKRLNPSRKDLFVRGVGFHDPNDPTGPGPEYLFDFGLAFENAGIDVHDTTDWGHDTTNDGKFFIYFGEGTDLQVTIDISGQLRTFSGSGTNWSGAWPKHEWEIEFNNDGNWTPIGYWRDTGSELGLDFEYAPVSETEEINITSYRIRKPLPHINVLIIYHDKQGLFGSPDPHIQFMYASPPSQQNPLGTRYWRWATKGYAWCQTTANQASMYGLAVALKRPLDHYFYDLPYVDGTTWGSSWESADVRLNPLSVVEDRTDQLDPIDGILGDGPDGNWDGDYRLASSADWEIRGDLNPFDIDNDKRVELPLATDPTPLDPSGHDSIEYELIHVLKHTITHEMAHALAGPSHTNFQDDLMYRYSNNWSRHDNLSDYYKSLLRIHNIVR
jgi:parallel beta-helix repeat protein